MSTGFTLEGFPSVGAWVSYALGSENQDLPAFVAIPDPRGVPQVGPANWGNGFLPAVFQGTAVQRRQADPQPGAGPPAIAAGDDARRPRLPQAAQRRAPEAQPRRHRAGRPDRRATSWPARMQLSAAEVGDLSRRDAGDARRSTALDDPNPLKAGFARNCLLARRLLERGVRFVQLFNGAYAMGEGVGNWDGHKQLKTEYDRHGPILDQPAAALLDDLKARGLLDDTLVVWTTEFGRMPTFQKGAEGRDHNPQGLHRLARRRRRQARLQLRRDRRVRLQGRRERGDDLRLPRHDPAPARPRPRAADASTTTASSAG